MTTAVRSRPELHIRYLRRLRGVAYPQVADFLVEMMAWPALQGASLYIDATGVGRAVLDVMRERGLHPIPVVITGGKDVVAEGSEKHIPKRDLVAAVQVLLQTGRLQVAEDLTEAATLATELGNFAVTISDRGHDSYNAAGSGHDDLVIAVSLVAWAMQRGAGAGEWTDFYRRTYGSGSARPNIPTRSLIVGVDLGQRDDYTAVAVGETVTPPGAVTSA